MIKERPARLADFGEKVLYPPEPFSVSWDIIPEVVRLPESHSDRRQEGRCLSSGVSSRRTTDDIHQLRVIGDDFIFHFILRNLLADFFKELSGALDLGFLNLAQFHR